MLRSLTLAHSELARGIKSFVRGDAYAGMEQIMQPVEIRIAALIFLIVVWAVIIGTAMDFFAVDIPMSLVALLHR
ncbi:hypothetical protein CO654_19265 [Rhizobium sp. L18]|nr:hypothetical protein CO654_19265 [Rhizobium sp. L18]